MSHSAVSATGTLEFDARIQLGNDLVKIDFDAAVPGLTRVFDRVIEVGNGLFQEVFIMSAWDMLVDIVNAGFPYKLRMYPKFSNRIIV